MDSLDEVGWLEIILERCIDRRNVEDRPRPAYDYARDLIALHDHEQKLIQLGLIDLTPLDQINVDWTVGE